MQLKLLREIIEEIAGKESGGVLDLLEGKRDVNEFLISKKLELTINQVRNIFYRLSNFGLVSFTRKKDKKKGWYTYFWTLNIGRALELLSSRLEKERFNTEAQLKSRQTKNFYLCNTCRTEVGEENALLHNFICPECGEIYVLNEDKKVLEDLESRISKIKKQNEEVLEELLKIKEQESSVRKRVEKKEKKKKDKERKDKREERKKEKQKELKKSLKTKPKKLKKPVKKKVAKKIVKKRK